MIVPTDVETGGARMSPESQDHPQEDPGFPDLASLVNAELLTALDRVLLELERRLLRYAQTGPEILEMADEGLVVAARAAARLAQAHSSAEHALGHLQIVGVGDWSPRSTQPIWRDDPRLVGDE
jgi:hypothetical protein